MTVKKLKEILSTIPDNYQIVLSRDAEGNSYSSLEDEVSECEYIPDTVWAGYIKMVWLPETEVRGFTQEECTENPNAICLWPIC